VTESLHPDILGLVFFARFLSLFIVPATIVFARSEAVEFSKDHNSHLTLIMRLTHLRDTLY
jgi:hypothetical protein